ncbi:DUF262 domain-containing protein [Cetobacterium ceti]
MQDLKNEISEKRKKSYSSMYNMVIREWVGMYEENEIEINPEYQRFFKWDKQRKTDLIESLLLGYPIPPIFVYKDLKTGQWEVIDGLQRLSTIFEFLGKLKDGEGNLLPPLELNEGKLIKNLKNMTWNLLDKNIKFEFNKLPLPILELNTSEDLQTKYELFKRLNTGGMNLNYQEKRVPIIISLQPEIYKFFRALANEEKFKKIFKITEKKRIEKEDMEYIVKYLVIKNIDEIFQKAAINEEAKIEYLLDKGIEYLLLNKEPIEIENELDDFKEILVFLTKNIDEKYCFRSYKSKTSTFLEYIFETVIYGLTNVIPKKNQIKNKDKIKEIILNIPEYSTFRKEKRYSNLKPIDRIKKSILYAKEIFGDIN